MSRLLRPGRLKTALVPLLWYLLVALGVPLLNGASLSTEHTVWVLAIPAAMVMIFAVAAGLSGRSRARRSESRRDGV